jgi:hypothetical protein
MIKNYLRKSLLLLTLVLCFVSALAQVSLQWTKPISLNANLPGSVEVYQTTTPLAGAPLRAFYMIADLADGDIEFKSVSGNGASKTLPQFAQDETETVFAIVNGGFSSGNQNLSLVSNGNTVSAPNVKAISRLFSGVSTTYFPTRGAFGILNTNQPDVAWIYNVGASNTTYFYPAPSANAGNGTIGTVAPEPQPTDVFPTGAALWNTTTAIGGSPVLVANGIKQITASEELIDANNNGKDSRTAVGYTTNGRVIFLVVEGRNPEVSDGVTLSQLADIMLSIGCHEALNLDGGGSSGMQVLGQNTIRAADAGVLRPTPSAFMLKRKPRIFDTDNATVYSETGAFTNSATSNFFGTSPSRQIVVGTGSNRAVYRFANLPPAVYRVDAWWVAFTNRATNTPFTIHRQGNFPNQAVRMNQTINSARFNVLGNFNLATGDSLVISNNALPAGSFINVDAIRLTKISDPVVAIAFANGDANEHVTGTDISFTASFTSPANGLFVSKLKIFKQVGAEAETQVGTDIPLDNSLSDTYNFVYSTATDGFGIIKFRFEVEDNFGKKTSKIYTATITPLTQVVFNPASTSGKHENDKSITLSLLLDTRRDTVKLSELKVFKSVNGGTEIQLGSTISLSQPAQTITYSYLVTERPADRVRLRFEVRAENGEIGQRTYNAHIIAKRGDYRIAVVSDLNSSFGSLTYEYQVDSIMQRIPRMFNPNMVVCGGDMVAGQSGSLTTAQLDAMWAAFDTKVATPFRNANIPFAFTVGNHDASDGFALERARTRNYWRTPGKYPGMHPIDTVNYPFYFSYMDRPDGDIFYVTWDANSSIISSAELEWTKQQFASAAAQKAKYRFLVGHLPLYGVAQERDSPGNVLPQPDNMRQWMEELRVHTYISGHQHAYYPAKRGKLELLNTGAAGSGPRRWLSIDKAPVNTMTLMDIFYDQDTIIYTTYDIRNMDAEAMALFDEKELPEIINGFQGFVIRRDVPLKNFAEGELSSLNVGTSHRSPASGQASVTINGDKVTINGTFSGLTGTLLRDRTALSLYQGLHGSHGKMITDLRVISTNGKSGSFSGEIIVDGDFKELLSTGNFYVLVKTSLFPDGEVRAQLYPSGNQAPPAPTIVSQNSTEVYAVRNIPGLFTVSWNIQKDPETNPVTYTYQVATDRDFNNIIIHEAEGRLNSFSRTQSEIYALLGNAAENQPVVFYHRAIASDGKNISYGISRELRLAKSNAPVVGVIEVLPPNYQYNCSAGIDNITLQCSAPFGVANATNIQGIATDTFGKVWYGINSGGVFVKNADGSAYRLTSSSLTYEGTGIAERVTSYVFNGTSHTLGTTGLGTDTDGNTLIAAGRRVVKFDAVTGQPLAHFIAPLPSETVVSFTNPTADTEGRIFIASVTGNNNFIIKQNGTGFDIIANNFALEERELARASAMSPNGKTMYVPANSGRNIHKYISDDGINFVREKVIVSPSAGGCNSVQSPENNVLYAVVNGSGPIGARLAVWDDNTNTFWSRELTEIPANFSTHTTVNMRGLAMSRNRDTLYIVNNSFGAVYRYVMPPNGDTGESPVTVIPTHTIQHVRQSNASGVSNSLGVYCRLVGVVNSQNFRPEGLDFAINEGGYGIQVFKNTGNANYTVTPGDRIAVMGYLRQVNGLLRMVTDSVRLIGNNHEMSTIRDINVLSDSVEYFPVRLKRLKLTHPSQWKTNQGYIGFEAEATDGANTSTIFVNSATNAFEVEPPTGEFEISGLGSQFKINSPFTSGFQLMPRSKNEITFATITTLTRDSLACNMVERIPVKTHGTFNADNTFVLQLSDTAGMFDDPTNIPIAIVNNFADVRIPVMIAGNRYKIRVQSSSPLLNSNAYRVAVFNPAEINVKQGTTDVAAGGNFTFGNQVVSTSSAVTTFTVENEGAGILSILGSPKIVISGANAEEFSVNETATTSELAAAGSTTFSVVFKPMTAGNKSAQLSITNSDANENPYVINLTGTGVACASPPKPMISQTSNATFTLLTLTSTEAPIGGTYQWLKNDSVMVDSTSRSFTTSEPGSYTVRVTVPGGCTTTSDAFDIMITAVEDATNPSIVLYPNPVKDWVTISLTHLRGKKDISIYDLSGKQMHTQETEKEEIMLSTTHFPKGMYLVKVATPNSIAVIKMIKQ